MIIEDLDILRPEPKVYKIGGHEVDLSFVPTGITFEVDAIIRELDSIDQKEILENGEATHKAFDLAVKLCTVFCEHNYPELDEDWFRKNTSAAQVGVMTTAIRQALLNAYKVGSGELKNVKATKGKTK